MSEPKLTKWRDKAKALVDCGWTLNPFRLSCGKTGAEWSLMIDGDHTIRVGDENDLPLCLGAIKCATNEAYQVMLVMRNTHIASENKPNE